ncbi:MAG: hypothetical protein EOO75_19510, partial [Myxococcales bacterium]
MSSEIDQRSALSQRLTVAIATPLVLLFALGLVLGQQILRLSEDARWVDHSDQVIATTNATLVQVVDQETGVRGYLVTGDRLFLEPFLKARPLDGFARLHELVADSPLQQGRFDEAKRRYEQWLSMASPVVDGRPSEAHRTPEVMAERKRQMDGIREKLGAALEIEQQLRTERVSASAASTASTKVVFLG